jgi:hypothetical protein
VRAASEFQWSCGIGDIEGKVARVATSERGKRASFTHASRATAIRRVLTAAAAAHRIKTLSFGTAAKYGPAPGMKHTCAKC